MRRNLIVWAATMPIISAIAVATPASARSAEIVLEPSTLWNVDYGDEKCRLARLFGEGEDKTILFMEQWGPDERFGFSVAGPAFNRFRSRSKTEIKFFDQRVAFETEPFTGDVEGFGRAVIHANFSLGNGNEFSREIGEVQYGLPQIETEIAKQAKYVAFKQGNRTVKLETGPLHEAFTVLNQCSHQRLVDWGLDLDKHLTIKQMPLWRNEKKIAGQIASIYPTRALREGESAIFRMRVLVNEDGSISDCKIYESTITEALQSPACDKMKGAEFDPALDAEGRPVKSFYQTTIIYRVN